MASASNLGISSLDRFAVYGRAGGLQIYELLAMADDAPGALDWVKCYEAGLTAWRAGDFTAAIDAFDKTLMLHPDDAASLLMIERCRQQLENPASADWHGTTVARTK